MDNLSVESLSLYVSLRCCLEYGIPVPLRASSCFLVDIKVPFFFGMHVEEIALSLAPEAKKWCPSRFSHLPSPLRRSVESTQKIKRASFLSLTSLYVLLAGDNEDNRSHWSRLMCG